MDCTLNWSYIHYGGLFCDSKYYQNIVWVSHTRPLKFISSPRKAKHFIGQLWQLMIASNVGAWTQAWQAKWAVFKILGFVCKRFLLFFPTPPRSFTCAICRAVFDSRSSFFAPKPHRNACYAGYEGCCWSNKRQIFSEQGIPENRLLPSISNYAHSNGFIERQV